MVLKKIRGQNNNNNNNNESPKLSQYYLGKVYDIYCM
jgi:hypothetical protein